jgi:porphobilinogen synthase
MNAGYPVARPRRLRRTPALRALVAETSLRPGDLVLPMFIKEGIGEPRPIGSMPGGGRRGRPPPPEWAG